MSEDLVNDQIKDSITDNIIDKLDALDDEMWEFFNDVSSEYGLHPDDDHEKIIQIMIDKKFAKQSR